MTQLIKQTPVFSREEFLTPFDSLFDNVIQKAFPTFGQEFGIEFFGNNSYQVNLAQWARVLFKDLFFWSELNC